jgi:GxxExxY protein
METGAVEFAGNWIMPIAVQRPVCQLSQAEFGALAYDVMRTVFELREELGRFFDEKIYKRALAQRFPGVQLEVPVVVQHGTFSKVYYLDVLVNGGAVFEFKTADKLTARHEAQLLHYLMLSEIEHGKLVNLRPEVIEHRFVNTSLRRADRLCFDVDLTDWDEVVDGASRFREQLLALLRDWGTGLELALYDEALLHLLGGEAAVVRELDVSLAGQCVGRQKMWLAADRIAYKVTALSDRMDLFAAHMHKQLAHTPLDAILWTNIGRKAVTFKTLRRMRTNG